MTTTRPVVPEIPSPEVVRQRLGEALREARLLRQQLAISERAAAERERRTATPAKEVAHASR